MNLPRPAEHAESQLLNSILDGTFAINSRLPNERLLAEKLGITRPTLREALQRLARDGWLDIQQGKSTRVRDYWKEGSLATLRALALSPHHQSPDFVANLLEIRLLLAPTYTRQALEKDHSRIASVLTQGQDLGDDPGDFAAFDWEVHHLLAQLAGNPIFLLLLNGFKEIYAEMGRTYFSFEECRQNSRSFYQKLRAYAESNDLESAESLSRNTMQDSLELWIRLGAES